MAIKTKAIRGQAMAMPERDKDLANRQEAARIMRLQQAVQQMPSQQAAQPQTAQALGAQQAQIAGQQALQRQQSTQQQAQALTGMALQGQQQAASGKAQAAELALKQQGIATEAELSDKQRQIEDEIFQNQLQFQKDELGRTEYKEEQMMDLALWSAQSEEDYRDRVQFIEQESAKELQLLEALNNRLTTMIKGEFAAGEQKLGHESKERMIEVQRKLQERIAKRKKDAARRGVMGQAGGLAGGIIGGVIGTYISPGAGTVAGAGIGATAGTMAGQTYSEQY